MSDYVKKAAANTFTAEQTVEADVHITDSGATNTRGVFFRSADHVNGIWYNGTTANELIFQTYDTFRFQKTVTSTSTLLEIMFDGIRLYHALFFRKNHADDLTYIVDDASGSIEYHAKSGGQHKFYVG